MGCAVTRRSGTQHTGTHHLILHPFLAPPPTPSFHFLLTAHHHGIQPLSTSQKIEWLLEHDQYEQAQELATAHNSPLLTVGVHARKTCPLHPPPPALFSLFSFWMKLGDKGGVVVQIKRNDFREWCVADPQKRSRSCARRYTLIIHLFAVVLCCAVFCAGGAVQADRVSSSRGRIRGGCNVCLS